MVVGEPGEPTGSCSCQTARLKLPPGATGGSRPGAAVVGGGVVPPVGSVQAWLAAPVQDQICSWLPLAELWPVASRHLPDPALTRAPPDEVHCWAAVPLHSYS